MDPYRDSLEHVMDELGRLDLVLRYHLEEWWAGNDGTVDEFRGLYVSDETVDGLLRSAYREDGHGLGHGSGSRTGGTGSRAGPESRTDAGSSEGPGHELLERIERADEGIRARESATAAEGRELRLVRLVERFGLDPRERDALLLALAPELDRRYETVYSYLQDDVTRSRPAVDLLLRVLCRSERERLEARSLFSWASPLLRDRLVRLSPGEGVPRPSRVVTVDERVVDFLLGGDGVAEELAPFTDLLTPGGTGPEPALEGSRTRRIDATAGTGRGDPESASGPEGPDPVPPMTYLHGPYGAGKGAAVMAACAEEDLPVLRADARGMAGRDVPETLRLLRREARLQDAALYVAGITRSADGPTPGAGTTVGPEPGPNADAGPTGHAAPGTFVAGLDRFDGPVFLSGTEPPPERLHLRVNHHEFRTVRFPVPSYERRKALWERVDGLPEEADPAELAAKFRFTGGRIADAVSTARHLSNGEGLTVDALYRGCRAQSNETLGSLARQVEPRYAWEDIVLPPDRMERLREVAARIRHQGTVYADWGFAEKFTLGNGLNVLFTGPSGTGKTMAAEIIARDAGLDLYKIDLSSVVSKYIGETEKNLRRIFDEAEETDAVLFFDEADALFGKRSEVKDAHDRYANIEVNYLLQRVEEHDGTVILTTNFKGNIDDAFLRRIHISVDFPRPDRESREAIWRIVFPETTPVDDLDFEFLSSLEVTGGNIRNVALTAAFMAAEDGTSVGMEQVVRAVRREFQKTGRLIRPEEFGRYRTMLSR